MLKVKVASSKILSTQSKKEIQESLYGMFGEKVEVIYEIDKTLIAGFTVKFGSKTLDLSVKSLLEKI
ncbi:MAG TPA: F0F1 ATP synthase subunit delta [Patescibacteria group bacterium]|nr:F0F1 ATP synthase subunit delta [Patescibacteria group bacterium]